MFLTFKKKTDERGRVSYTARSSGWLFVMTHRITDEQKLLLERHAATGQPLDVMIIGPLGSHPKGLTVDIVTKDHELVEHRGFECAGSMCSTTAFAPQVPGREFWGSITPGRCQDILPVADNVNARFDRRPEEPKHPGRIYVLKGERRGAGVPFLEDISLDSHAAYVRHQKRMAEYRRKAA